MLTLQFILCRTSVDAVTSARFKPEFHILSAVADATLTQSDETGSIAIGAKPLKARKGDAKPFRKDLFGDNRINIAIHKHISRMIRMSYDT
ncbi:hypothetical protein X771_02255 [Mesorhizobium sp. LSJC277A00]|nr:hypothetical protein X771_02255 [Mesorhizobium sp. LSJC277A00]